MYAWMLSVLEIVKQITYRLFAQLRSMKCQLVSIFFFPAFNFIFHFDFKAYIVIDSFAHIKTVHFAQDSFL